MTLPSRYVRDESARSLIGKILTRDPSAAYEWSRNISNEASRNEMMEQVMRVWVNEDPEGAQAATDAPAARP